MKDKNFNKNSRRKKILLKNTLVIYIAYYIPIIATLGAIYVGLTDISFKIMVFYVIITTSVTSFFVVIILVKKNISNLFANFVNNGQYLGWIVIYVLWVVNLNEARVIGLMFAIMSMVFLLSNSSLMQSLFMTFATVIMHLSASYYAINYMGSSGSFSSDIFYTCCFIPTSLFISFLARQFKNQRRDIKIAKRNAEKARDQLWGEMELAKKIQTVLLPRDVTMSGYEIDAYMKPADEVGGDYYDIINVAEHDWIVIGDVSGHGVPAGLIMMMVQTAIHVTVKNSPELSPSELLNRINSTISYNIQQLGEDKYMTITVLAAHTEGKFSFSGLHQDILIYRSETNKVECVETDGIWLGVVDPLKGMLEDHSLSLNSGDTCMLYTDGLTEAVEKGGSMYSQERLEEVLLAHGDQSPSQIKKAVIKDMNEYIPGDDVTIVIIKRV